MLIQLFDFLFTTFPFNLLFLELLYRPFFNLLVFIYTHLPIFGLPADMGLAVIIFTIALRLILLPLSLREELTYEERKTIEGELRLIKPLKSSDPLFYKKERERIVSSHRHIFLGEILEVALQIWIALMLWRIFSLGLEGADFNLLYSFIKAPAEGFNLTFFGIIDLSHPSLTMNLITSLLIFVIETLSLEWAAIPTLPTDRWVQFLFPAGAFIYLYQMPAGKKLFIITTLVFTLGIMFFKEGRGIYKALLGKKNPAVPEWRK